MATLLIILLLILDACLFFCLGFLFEMKFTNEVMKSWKNTLDEWDKDSENFKKLLDESIKK